MFAACNGTPGRPARHALPHERLQQGGQRNWPAPANPEYVYVPHRRVEALFRHGARMRTGRPDVPVAARRELRRAPIHHRGARRSGASICPMGMGLPGPESTTECRRSPSRTDLRGIPEPCFDYQTLGDELDKAQAVVAFLRQRVRQRVERRRRRRGRAIRRSDTSSTGPTGRKTSSRRTGSSSPTSRRASWRTSPGSRRSATTPITSTAAAATVRRGLRRWSTRSVRASSGIQPRSSCNGTIGAVSTIHVRAAIPRSRQPRLPRSADRDLAVRASRTRLAHALRNGERAALRRGSLRSRRSSAAADARANSPAADCFDFSQTPRPFVHDQRAASRRSSSCTVAPTMTICTRLRVTCRLCDAVPLCFAALPRPCGLRRRIAAQVAIRRVAVHARATSRCGRLTRPAPARSSTSSTSCRRTAASTISFRTIPAPIPVSSGKNSKGENDQAAAVSLEATAYEIDHPMHGDVRGLQRHGQTTRNPLPHGRLRQRVESLRRSAEPAVRLRAARSNRSRTSTWRTKGCCRPDVPVAARRELRRASVHHRRAGGVERRPAGGAWGCERREATITSRRSRTDRTLRPEHSPLLRLSDARRRARQARSSRGAFTPAQYGSASSGDGAEWSAYQAVKHIRYGPDWKKDVISPNWKFITDVRAGQARQLHLDHAGLRRLRSRQLPRRLRPVVGRGAGQHRRQEQVLGLDGDLRAVGRLGRPLRSRPAAVQGSRRLGLPRSAARDLAVRQARTTSRTCSTKRRACCALPKISSGLAQLSRSRRARELAGRRLLRLHAKAAPVREDRGAACRRASSCTTAAAITTLRPTTNRR